jgi:hypothetical protein
MIAFGSTPETLAAACGRTTPASPSAGLLRRSGARDVRWCGPSVTLLVPTVSTPCPPQDCTRRLSFEYQQRVTLELRRWTFVGSLGNWAFVKDDPSVYPTEVIVALPDLVSCADGVVLGRSLMKERNAKPYGKISVEQTQRNRLSHLRRSHRDGKRDSGKRLAGMISQSQISGAGVPIREHCTAARW